MTTVASYTYVGSELPLFARAVNWKSYWRSHVERWLGDNVLEVGAGIGGTTELLCRRGHHRWVCLEPDATLARELEAKARAGEVPACCQVKVGVVADLPADEKFDSILYIDVLEHIEHDAAEMERAARHLNPGGVLIVLSPAHPWLFSEFDHAIGHYRRYTRKMLHEAMPKELERVKLIYLDAVGSLASALNRLVLRSPRPTPAQIKSWDRIMVRASRWVDPVFGYRVGKSVIGIYRKPA
jgi:SAM-dependent methyltransferase